MSQKVAQIKEQGIEESSKKIMQKIASKWHQKIILFWSHRGIGICNRYITFWCNTSEKYGTT